MQRQNVRVLLASEHAGTRSLLRRIVETEDKTVIVAEAENGTRALNLARSLRPDVMLIDSYLPSVVGLDNVPLSRVGGLDVAQSISQEIPNMHVVLLNTLSDGAISEGTRKAQNSASLCRESNATCIPFKLGELNDRVELPGLIFANVETQASALPEQKTRLSDKIILAGILGIIAGWLMILTMFLATVGLYVSLAGITAALFGLAAKRVSKSFK